MTTKFKHLRPVLGFKASVDCYINRCSDVLEKRTKSFDIFYFPSERYLLNLWWFCFLTVFVFVLRVSCLFHPIQKLLVSHVIFFSSACLRLTQGCNSLFLSRLSLEMMVRDVQFRDARCLIRETRREYKSARNFHSPRTRSSSGAAFRSTYSKKMWTVLAKSYDLKFFVVMYSVQNVKHTRKHLSNEYKLSFNETECER